MKRIIALLLMVSLMAMAAPLPDEVRDAVRALKSYDYSQPRAAAYLLEQFTPKAAGDPEQRAVLAALLADAVLAPDTTPHGRTILCQRFALVAGEAEAKKLARMLDDPKTAADARIALQAVRGFAVGAPQPPPAKSACLADAADSKPATRVAGLASLAKFHPSDALPVLIKALGDPDAKVAATAIQLCGKMHGETLAAQLTKLDAPRQVLALGVLAENKVAAARGAVTALASSAEDSVRLAAIGALGGVGDATSLPVLVKCAAEGKGAVKTAAENALSQLAVPGVDEAILRGVAAGEPAARVAMINVAAARSLAGAIPALLAAAREESEGRASARPQLEADRGRAEARPSDAAAVQTAALKALAKLGDAAVYPQLVEFLATVRNAAAEEAIAAVGRQLTEPQARVAPLLALLARPGMSAEAQAAVLRTLALTGGPAALTAMRDRLASTDAALRDAAVRALAEWPEAAALADLMKLAEDTTASAVHRTLALRGVLRLAPLSGEQALAWLKRAQPLAKSAAEKRQWLGALAESPSPEALKLAEAMAADAEVKTEAQFAATKIGRVIGVKSKYSDARRTALAKTVPPDCRIVAYLDCGVERMERAKDGVQLALTHGGDWTWQGEGDPAALTVAFAGGHVDFSVLGFDPKKSYQLGFTWWDQDGNGRAQSVWVGGQKLVERTTLPQKEGPATITRAIPAEAIRGGKTTISFRQEATSNAVVCELWLVEAPPGARLAASPIVATTPPITVSLAKPAQPVVKANAGVAKKALIVTGLEYPGHKWKETTPVLVEALAQDKRLEISVVDDAAQFLNSPDLARYDVIVLHYQNHEIPAPEGALAKLKSAVEAGKGLVLVHFACGAFIDWQTRIVPADFEKIAGRVWNPKLRGHDPRGPFQVRITDRAHPITVGLADFDTDDELYTCLDGATPIQVLATATSKVDQKDYPMAFVLTPGKGRTFHCVLGHDPKALGFPAVGQLFRRGTAWAAGLEPAP